MLRTTLLLSLLTACGSTPDDTELDTEAAEPVTVRFATFNVSLFRSEAGELVSDLGDSEHEQARAAAAIIQEVRPDVLLLNEVDWDADGEAVSRLLSDFIDVGQDGREAMTYEHVYLPPVNTGAPSGVDLDGNGSVGGAEGSDDYGNDSFGFGTYPGQYGLVVLSRYPIDEAGVRTFRELLWKDLPGHMMPPDYYSSEAEDALRLSSKTHADVPVQIDGATVHFLVSHPTPPNFDGAEDRNGRRNHDEIAFWTQYLDADSTSWQVDDQGRQGGLDGASFVIAGDLNSDPEDGGSAGDPIADLVAHARVVDPEPSSVGGEEQAELQAGRNFGQSGDPALDTADFNDSTVGNLRVDFVLPSADLPVLDAGVFWPASDDPNFELVGTHPFPVSDHRLVWVDVEVGG